MTSSKWWWVGLCVAAMACGSEGPTLESDGLGDSRDDVRGERDAGSDARAQGGGASRGDSECKAVTLSSLRTVPDMLIVLDRSSSMAPQGNETRTDRWSGSVRAVNEVAQQFDTRIRFGLVTFPAVRSGRGLTASCAPGSVNVEVGPGRGAEIATTLAGMTPNGYTPTAATLEAVRSVIGETSAVDAVVPPKYVLLVTDGDPNCSASWSSGSGLGQPDPEARQQTISAIEALTDLGVKTYVVGYQTAGTGFVQQLDMMAAAGGTGERAHRSVDSGEDLVSAFEEIADRAVSCSYKLERPVSDASYVLVTVAGRSRGHGNAADGWTLGRDMQTITVTGAACDAVQRGATFTVEVVCAPVSVI